MKLFLKTSIVIILFSQFFSCKNDPSLFKSLSADETGITFSNRITENDTMNVLDFEYIYNGGGVGMGDFNGDGLQDVYFTGNQVANKLYLNKTDTTDKELKFEDITDQSKTSGNGKWCSGVAIADVNADGKMDIYVCANVKKPTKDRENMLYINKGNDEKGVPIFAEMAAEYGLNDTTFSTNAAFFDYDNDGDLDAYILVDQVDKKSSPNNFHNKLNDGTAPNNDQLYRNDFDPKLGHAVFTNITKEAGILKEGFGLGVNITDINRDGWKDIFVTNDFITNDLMWINNKNGKFTDEAAEYFKHTSSSAMGNDVADLNNDGLADIYCLDMLPEDNYRKKMLMMPNNYLMYQNNEKYGFQYQYVRNTLQLNLGKKPNTEQQIFSEISLLANVAETDWSWCPLLLDFDNDGFRDIIVTNGFPKDVTDHDFITFKNERSSIAGSQYLLDLIPVVKINNYAFKNKGNLEGSAPQFENVTNKWGINQPSFSNGAAYADLDNDGDMDYIVNNINDSAFVYQNQLVEKKLPDANYLKIKFKGDNLNTQGIGAIVELNFKNGQKMVYENSPFRGYLSTVEAVAHFGLGKNKTADEVKIIWQNGKTQILEDVKANQTILADVKNATNSPDKILQNDQIFSNVTDSLGINYMHSELDFIDFNIQKLLPHKFSQYGPSLAVGDVNGDGLDDVFIGGSNYRKGKFLIQNQAGKFTQKDLLPGTDTLKTEEDAGSLLIDVDNDNDLDLYIVSGGSEFPKISNNYQDRLFINDKGTFVQNFTAIPQILKSGSCAKAADFDKDGDLDLFVGGRVIPENYPKATSSYILRNDSSPLTPNGGKSVVKFTDITKQVAPELQNIGLTCDMLWTDFDNDGWIDIALVGEWMPIKFLKNGNGKSFSTIKTDLDKQFGLWNSLAGGDFDNDGDIDYLAGNLGLNSLNRATDLEPLKIYGKDFNTDGLYDAIPTTFYLDENGKKQEYPYHVREDMIKQIITTRAKYPDFAKYAKAKITDMFSPEEMKGADVYQANYLSSSYIENLGGGKFKISALPTLAQTSPIFGMSVEDVDNDGLLDAILLGNDYGTELTNGRYDAMTGIVLKNKGNGSFSTINSSESGFYVPLNAKALVNVRSASGTEMLMATQNRGNLLAFKSKNSSKNIPISKNDLFALITTKSGKTRKEEFYFGQSFYSSGSRSFGLSGNSKSVEIVDNKGVKRKVE